ncbi:MAG: 3-isopropylmalate dehydratase small subunit [Clostridia bacterium]|nr:3-isopropylmalate dehydratase small subunit [Clostridia bacterium]
METRGKVFRYGDDVNTDVIIPARYLNTADAGELALHCMEDIDPKFVGSVQSGDVIVAGDNFGCGSSREHAPMAIKASGISCVIANSFARIFYRNAINIGLPILECPAFTSRVVQGDEVAVDLETGKICNLTTMEIFQAEPFPLFLREMMATGGLIAATKKRLAAARPE